MKDRFNKLLTIKSIITISLTGVVIYLALIGKFNIEQIYLMIIGFYFGTQSVKEG